MVPCRWLFWGLQVVVFSRPAHGAVTGLPLSINPREAAEKLEEPQ
jgi:hypothetical protein